MFGDLKVKDSSPPMLDHQEHEQYPQADRRHHEEIDRDELSDMILEEGFLGPRGWPLDGLQDARHVRPETSIPSFFSSP
jgi:hypothetical protein